jgi:hypothetical protein
MGFCSGTILTISKSCESNYGGLQRIGFASATAVSEFLFDADQVITGITVMGDTFIEWEFENHEASEATLNVTDTVVMNKRLDLQTVELTINLNKLTKASRLAMQAVKNKDLVALVKDENGVWLYLGYAQPLRKSARTYTSGSQRNAGDNGYSITFSCEEKNDPFLVADALAKTLLP